MLTDLVGRPTYDPAMTIADLTPQPFGRARVYTPNWGDDTTDADYDDPAVIAANIERERVAARARVAARIERDRRAARSRFAARIARILRRG